MYTCTEKDLKKYLAFPAITHSVVIQHIFHVIVRKFLNALQNTPAQFEITDMRMSAAHAGIQDFDAVCEGKMMRMSITTQYSNDLHNAVVFFPSNGPQAAKLYEKFIAFIKAQDECELIEDGRKHLGTMQSTSVPYALRQFYFPDEERGDKI